MSIRIGKGEFTSEGLLDLAVKDGRARFLSATARWTPQVLMMLHDRVLPVFAEYSRAVESLAAVLVEELAPSLLPETGDLMLGVGGHVVLLPDTGEELTVDDVSLARDAARGLVSTERVYELLRAPHPSKEPYEPSWTAWSPVRAALSDWSGAFHLSDDWCREAAVRTVGLWHWVGTLTPELAWYAPYFNRVVPTTAEQREFRFEWSEWREEIRDKGWSVDRESWADFETRIRVEFMNLKKEMVDAGFPARGARKSLKQVLRSYRDRIEAAATRSMTRTSTKRESDDPVADPEAERHFRWLALFQCAGRSSGDIASSEGLARSTVVGAVRSTAAEIGLRLRPTAPGRPKSR